MSSLEAIIFVVVVIAAYFAGSVPTGVVLGKKLKGIDIREHGSKNTGATNAYRVLGPKLGITVLLIDILKGFLPVAIAKYLAAIGQFPPTLIVVVGLIAIIGHTFSVFLRFKGGKGVATSLGVFLAFEPFVMLIVVVVFIVIVGISKYVSLGSITAASIFPFLCYYLPKLFNKEPNIPVVGVSILVAVYIIIKHKSNIRRLVKGEENKFNIKREG